MQIQALDAFQFGYVSDKNVVKKILYSKKIKLKCHLGDMKVVHSTITKLYDTETALLKKRLAQHVIMGRKNSKTPVLILML